MKNLHLKLPESVVDQLDRTARTTGTSRTRIVLAGLVNTVPEIEALGREQAA